MHHVIEVEVNETTDGLFIERLDADDADDGDDFWAAHIVDDHLTLKLWGAGDQLIDVLEQALAELKAKRAERSEQFVLNEIEPSDQPKKAFSMPIAAFAVDFSPN